jgi:hypothetical protein
MVSKAAYLMALQHDISVKVIIGHNWMTIFYIDNMAIIINAVWQGPYQLFSLVPSQ